MKFVPYESFYLKTKVTAGEVAARLAENTAPRNRYIFQLTTRPTKLYRGFVNDSSFRLSRVIRYRNSFRPLIMGQIIAVPNGTVVKVKMRMHVFVYTFMSLWLGFVVLAGAAIVKDMINKHEVYPAIYGILVMFVFGYGLTLGAFKYESSKSKKFFRELLEAELI